MKGGIVVIVAALMLAFLMFAIFSGMVQSQNGITALVVGAVVVGGLVILNFAKRDND